MHNLPQQIQQRMKIDVIRSADSWSAMAQEWNTLLQASHLNLPFLTYEFQRAWWEHLGGGEWQTAELHILAARDEQGQLVGIAPLFRAPHEDGSHSLRLIGCHEIADFLDFICRPQDLDAFVAAVLEHVQAFDGWQEAEFYNLLSESQTLAALPAAATAAGLQVEQETLQPSPYIVLPKTFDEYVEQLDSKQAHELRRKMRKAARNVVPLSTEVIRDAAELDPALNDFFALMTQEGEKASFLKPAMRAQMEAIARSAFAAGWLQLIFLKAGQERIAAYLNFDYDNRIWGYNAGFSNAHGTLSPGWLMMAEMMTWAIENGRAVFDFMRGGEEYKYRFGAVDRFVTRVRLSKA